MRERYEVKSMLEIVKTEDLLCAAQFTFNNMKPFYEMYNVDWCVEDVLQASKGLSNFDIHANGQQIGILRLSFDEGRCQLRDIQVGAAYQSKDFGAKVIHKVVDIARHRNLQFIDLKVFQRSPAHKLYRRLGFEIVGEDERCFYMSLPVSQ